MSVPALQNANRAPCYVPAPDRCVGSGREVHPAKPPIDAAEHDAIELALEDAFTIGGKRDRKIQHCRVPGFPVSKVSRYRCAGYRRSLDAQQRVKQPAALRTLVCPCRVRQPHVPSEIRCAPSATRLPKLTTGSATRRAMAGQLHRPTHSSETRPPIHGLGRSSCVAAAPQEM
jgi:hypothetical protein